MKRMLIPSLLVLLASGGCSDICFSGDCVGVCGSGECGDNVCFGLEGNSNGIGCYPEEGALPCDSSRDCRENQRCWDGWCRWADTPVCEGEWDCPAGEYCANGRCQQEEPWCWNRDECLEGQVCSLSWVCVDVVDGCPLTDECLADPDGYYPDWAGIDPLYMGTASGDGVSANLELLVDFYEDHFYGEAVVSAEVPSGFDLSFNLIVTGERAGAELSGMIIDAAADERWFDATFEAQLITASQILGTVTVASDDGNFVLDLNLLRISPCGCEVASCGDSSDCPEGQACSEEGTCVDSCEYNECCQAADCPEGDDCLNGTCVTPCSSPCDCELGEACVDGHCQPTQ